MEDITESIVKITMTVFSVGFVITLLFFFIDFELIFLFEALVLFVCVILLRALLKWGYNFKKKKKENRQLKRLFY
jgi:hypothetical protein